MSAFTVTSVEPLPVTKRGEHWWLETSVREVRLSNLDKVFFPQTGYTKGDLLTYYWNARERVLPYVRSRPLTLIWYPNGIEGGHILMKDPPIHAPDWLPLCELPHFNDPSGRNRFPMCNDESHLMYLVNLGCIDLHPLHARCDAPSAPDYVFVDIDPAEGAAFDDVRAVASHVHAAFGALDLPAYAKTTGATGIHVYVPIERNVSFASVREFVERIALAIRKADPKRVTLDWAVDKRTGKVFIDINMNRRGQNAVSAWCVRPRRAATVAVPVTWDEVAEGFDPGDFDITNVARRVDANDPLASLINEPIDIRDAMRRVGVEPEAP